MTPVSCPYCNSTVDVPDGIRTVHCPRCGEAFPHRDGAAHAGNGFGEMGSASLGTATRASAGARRSNRQTAFMVLCLMFAMGGIALGFVLVTTSFRRSHDPAAGPGMALGYLPPDANLLAFVHVHDLLQHRAGKEFLDTFGLAAGQPDHDSSVHLLGVPLDNVDVMVLSMKTDAIGFRPILFVQTIKPYDANAVRAAVDTSRPVQDGYRSVYPIRSAKLPFKAIWLPAANVLAFGSRVESFEAIPQQAGDGVLPSWLTALIPDAAAQPVWLASQEDDLTHDLASWLPALPAPDRAALHTVYAVGAWMKFDEAPAVDAKVECTDAKQAAYLAKLLSRASLADVKLNVKRADKQLTFHASADMATLRRAVLDAVLPSGRK